MHDPSDRRSRDPLLAARLAICPSLRVRWREITDAVHYSVMAPGVEVAMSRRDVGPLPVWSQTIVFRLVVPDQNRYRRYCLQLTPDLFGAWVLLRHWGRIGKAGRTRLDTFASRSEAERAAEGMVRRRLLHGYRVTAAV